MSQKKMEAYKEAKKNKRQIEKKQKRNKILGWILGILIAAAIIGGSAYLVYYSSVILPNKNNEETEAAGDNTIELSPEDLNLEQVNPEDAGEVLDGTAMDSIMVTPEDADTTDEAAGDTAEDTADAE